MPFILVLEWNLAFDVDSESHNAVFEAEFSTLTVASVSTLNVLLLLFPSFLMMEDIFLMFYSIPRGYELSCRSELSESTREGVILFNATGI